MSRSNLATGTKLKMRVDTMNYAFDNAKVSPIAVDNMTTGAQTGYEPD